MEDLSKNFASLFNPKGAEPVQSMRLSDEYKVSYRDGKSGVYRSVIRFIPFWANPDKSIMQKLVTYVKDPITQKGVYVDDPRSIGSPSPVNDMYWKMQNTKNVTFMNFAKDCFSTRNQYASLVQIIKDEQHPDLVGQIKVFRYGKKLWDKLYQEEHPQIGQGSNPFHPTLGRYFSITCVAQSQFNNFDQSQFVGQSGGCPMWFKNPKTDKFENVTDDIDQNVLLEYLKTSSPDLNAYSYKPWTVEQQQQVDTVLALAANYLQNGTIQQNLGTVATPQADAPVGTANAVGEALNSYGLGIPPISAAPISVPGTARQASAYAPPVNLGGIDTLGAVSTAGPQPQGVPSITGIDIPNVEPATVKTGAANGVPSIGITNIQDVIDSL